MKQKTTFTALFKTLALTLVLAVLLPSATKLTHVFTHHSHQVCDSDGELKTHFHESDLDCDFYKFKLTNTQFLIHSNYDIVASTEISKNDFSHYISLNNYQQTSKFVRGPPTLLV